MNTQPGTSGVTLGLEPERQLYFAVLERAIEDLKGISKWNSQLAIHQATKAYYWFFPTKKEPWPLSFESICSSLNLDPEQILSGLRREIKEIESHL